MDSLHLARTGGIPDDLVGVSGIRGAQICDGPRIMPPDRQEFEGLEQRQLPGDGEFPLKAFLKTLPPDIHLGVEVPLRDLRDRGVGPRERARLAVMATRRIMADIQQN